MLDHPNFLTRVLLVDAATCLLTGLLMTVGSSRLGAFTQISGNVLFEAGVILYPSALLMAFVALIKPLPPLGVRVIIFGNIAWVVGSALLLLTGFVAPSVLGVSFIVAQAVAVALLAWLEMKGLERLKHISFSRAG